MNIFSNEDILEKIILYLNVSDLLELRNTNKAIQEALSKDNIWKLLGERDRPYLFISNERDFHESFPFNVKESEIQIYLAVDTWASKQVKKIYDHRQSAYLRDIVRNLLIVRKLYALDNRIKDRMTSDWRSCMKHTIEIYLNEVDREVDEMDFWFPNGNYRLK